MAAVKCIATLVSVEEKADYLDTLCRVLHEVAPESPPEWLALFAPLVGQLRQALEEHGNVVRGRS